MPRKIPILLLLWLAFLLLGCPQLCSADTAALFDQAQSYQDEGQYQQAEAIYKQILTDHPGTDHALAAQTELVGLYIKWGKQTEADAAYEELLAKFSAHPSIAGAIANVAHVHRVTGHTAQDDERLNKYERARDLFNYVVQKWPQTDVAVWCQMAVAVTSVALGDEGATAAAFEKLQAEYASDANVAKIVGPLKDSCKYLLEIREQRPAKFEWMVNKKLLCDFREQNPAAVVDHIGDFYRDAGQYDKAVELFQYTADTWHESKRGIEAQAGIVRLYISIGDEPNAHAAFAKLVEGFSANEGLPGAVERVAEKYYEVGNRRNAYDKYKYIVENWPQYDRAIWAYTGMIMSQVWLFDFEAAEAGFKNLLTQFSGDERLSDLVDEIVGSYYSIGEYERGKRLFQELEALQSAQQDKLVDFQVGIVLSNIGLEDDSGAQAAIEKLVADFNNHPKLPGGLLQIGEKYYELANWYLNKEDKDQWRNYARRATDVWERVIFDLPHGDYTEVACYYTGRSHEWLDEFETAIVYYETAVANWPNGEWAAHAQYHIMRCWYDAQVTGLIETKTAVAEMRRACKKLVTHYPDSPMVRFGISLLGGPDHVGFLYEGEGEEK